ncbi:conserved membrane hypothetical protein [Burkholderia latens]|uniref:hypothetical protein n=1 Tax=Burkholderia latens TaxID=488446 RepID=UPI0039A787C6
MRNVFWLVVLPIIFFGGSAALYFGWSYRFKEFEALEDMHGIAATAIVTSLIFLAFLAHGAPLEFAASPEMLIVSAAVSLEVIYDHAALYFSAKRNNAGTQQPSLMSYITSGMFFAACVVCVWSLIVVYEAIGNEVARKALDVYPYTSGLWGAAFVVGFGHKYLQGRAKVRAKEAAKQAAKTLLQTANQQ